MNINYHEILEAMGEPKWWTTEGFPRYVDFNPREVDVYAETVALVRCKCQACGREFLVAFHDNGCMGKLAVLDGDPHGGWSTLHDPPNVSCCPAGPTMSSDWVVVLECWPWELQNFKDNCPWVRCDPPEWLVRRCQEDRSYKGEMP
jgi:hypothetical protein